MKRARTTILYHPREITLFYSMWPLLRSPYWHRFDYTTELDRCLNHDPNQRILIVGFFLYEMRRRGEDYVVETMARIRKKYGFVAFWDDNDGSGIDYAAVLPYVDVYYKKQILKDRTAYTRPLWGTRPYGVTLFGDYYVRNQLGTAAAGIEEIIQVKNPADLEKLKLVWNLSWGSYPLIDNRVQKVGTPVFTATHPWLSRFVHRTPRKFPYARDRSGKRSACSFRYSRGKFDPAIGFQREYMTKILTDAGFEGFERVTREQFYLEMAECVASFSPFGWGEVCFRDFESLLAGCVVIKPDCGHFETYPDMYRAGETYASVRWDGSDLVAVVRQVLDSPALRKQLCEGAEHAYWEAWNGMEEWVSAFAESVLGQ